MDYLIKASRFEEYLNSTENGFMRKDSDNGVMFAFSDKSGFSLGVTFLKDGRIIAATAVFSYDTTPPGSEEMLLHLFNRLNIGLTLCKVYRDDKGIVWLSSPFCETAEFSPGILMALVMLLINKAPSISDSISRLFGAVTFGGESFAQ